MRLKSRLLAVTLALLFGMSNLSAAAMHVSVSAARSSSYRAGFSSQKSQPARPANSNARSTKNTSFGSFGQQPRQSNSRPDSATNSAMNRDLEKNQAQQQALKNLDARNGQKAGAQPAQQTSVSGKPLNPAPSSNSAAMPPAQAPTVIVQRESGSMGGALLGFMLGQAISRPHVVNSYDNRNRDLQPLASVGAVSNGLEQQGNGTLPASAPAAPAESAAWKLLRLLLWLGLISGLGWIAYRLYRFFMPAQQTQSHYSLGKV